MMDVPNYIVVEKIGLIDWQEPTVEFADTLHLAQDIIAYNKIESPKHEYFIYKLIKE